MAKDNSVLTVSYQSQDTAAPAVGDSRRDGVRARARTAGRSPALTAFLQLLISLTVPGFPKQDVHKEQLLRNQTF